MATLNGGEGPDTITGTSNGDTITARGGNDIVNGLGGNDTIDAGDGDDTVNGGDGNDTINAGVGLDTVHGGAGDDTIVSHGSLTLGGAIFGDDGNDSLEVIRQISGAKVGDVSGGAGDDTLYIAIGEDDSIGLISGGDGFDTLWADTPVFDFVTHVSGIERFIAQFGTIGSNIVFSDGFATGGAIVEIILTFDGGTADASAETDSRQHFIGKSAAGSSLPAKQTFIGGHLADIFEANSGDDVIRGNGGDDYINGGDGIDTAIYAGNFADYTITEVTYNTFTVKDNVGSDGTDTIVDVNVLRFADGDHNIVISGLEIIGDETDEDISGGAQADHLDGAGGDDTVVGAGGNDTEEGGTGNDTVAGGDGNDFLFGDAGDDVLSGGAGDDELSGGAGSDTYALGDSNDAVIEDDSAGDPIAKLVSAPAVDTITTTISRSLADYKGIENITLLGTGNINATGNAVANVLKGNTGTNTLIGGDGNDTLDGGKGADKLDGGRGDDTYVVDNARDALFDSSGKDTVQSTVSKTLATGFENLVLLGAGALIGNGNSVANAITGNDGKNTLNGAAGNDTLDGGKGIDIVIGGAGKDKLTGGAQADHFDFNGIADSGKTAATRDIITDFSTSGGDVIDLSTIDASSKATGNNKFSFIKTAAFHHKAGELHYVKQDASGVANDKTIVEGDVNGDGKADFQIELTGLKTLSATDFAL